jgi:photosystem II stability/assembly factor-like uncharacterized protein
MRTLAASLNRRTQTARRSGHPDMKPLRVPASFFSRVPLRWRVGRSLSRPPAEDRRLLLLVLTALLVTLPRVAGAGLNTWTSNGPYSPYGGELVYALAINPVVPTTLYAGTVGGVFRSTDGGNSWSAANGGVLDQLGDVRALVINPTSPSILYAGIPGSIAGVFRSTDGGNSWSTLSQALAYGGAFSLYIYSLAIDPVNPSIVYVGIQDEGVFRSTDGGESWSPAGAGLPGNFGGEPLAINPLTPTTLYAGSNIGVFRSTDSGESWSFVGLSSVAALAVNPVIPSVVYAGANGFSSSGVFRSTDGGNSWVNTAGLKNVALTINALAIDPTTPSTLYAGTNGGGVFQSTNSGASWSAVNTGLTNLTVNALAINPVNPRVVYAGTQAGVFGIELQQPPPTPAALCVGDCSSRGSPSVADVLKLVNIALGAAEPSTCPTGIPAGVSVNVGLIIQAVNNVLDGCPRG